MFNKPGRFARAFSCASGWLLSVGWQVAGVRRIVRVVAFGVVVLLTVCFSVGAQGKWVRCRTMSAADCGRACKNRSMSQWRRADAVEAFEDQATAAIRTARTVII